MTQEEQIEQILELETAIRGKQTSLFSAHTLVPIGLVMGIVSSVFFFGVTFQRLNNLEDGYAELKLSTKEELLNVKTELKNISAQLADIKISLAQK